MIYNNEFSSLTNVAWNPLNKDSLVVASEAGDIYILNIKEPTEVLCSTHCFDGSIYKVCFNHSGLLGVTGSISNVLIYNCQNDQLLKCYETLEHNTVIKGLTWNKNNLYSCGFNKKLACYCN